MRIPACFFFFRHVLEQPSIQTPLKKASLSPKINILNVHTYRTRASLVDRIAAPTKETMSATAPAQVSVLFQFSLL